MPTSTTPPSTPGDRRPGAETRAEILRVALGLFIDNGYEGTSTRDISSALGMTKSSLYYHFPSKESIMAALVAERRGELDDLVEWITAQPRTPDLLLRAAERWIGTVTPERLQIMRLGAANQPIMKRIAESDDVPSGFDRVIDLVLPPGAPEETRLLARMSFDTARAALLSAQGTTTSAEAVIAAALRATRALAEVTTTST